MGAEDRIGPAVCTPASQPAAIGEQRIDELPHDLVAHGDLYEPPGRSFTDERIAVGLSFCSAYLVAVKGNSRLATVIPDNLVVGRIDLHDPGVVCVGRSAVRAVVEQQHMTIIQEAGIVLMG